MDKLFFLILDKLHDLTYYNSASILNLYPRDPDFAGYAEQELSAAFATLVAQNMLAPHPVTAGSGRDRNYYLTEKGKGAYLKEKKLMEDKRNAEEIQKQISDSMLQVNRSIVETNESVKQTNQSMREINSINAINIPKVTKMTMTNVVLTACIILLTFASLMNTFFHKNDTDVLNELSETDKILKEQNQEFHHLLRHQIEIDSILFKRIDSLPHK
jgi:hypothetical protein